ncbi:MAG: hypothetical protein OXC46_00425 [Thaumarchaeota archaeon]|nr:hypothetical protein [Nitrososphaerota archaeon]
MQDENNTRETVAGKKYNDSLEEWLNQHLGKIPNLETLLHNFKDARNGQRRNPGHIFHAELVREFYENDNTLKVTAVECKNIEPNTDVDIKLNDDIYIQVWLGKKPAEYTLERNLTQGTNKSVNWDESERPVLKKLKQLPSNTGKCFVLNGVTGISGIISPTIHELCSERKCVMEISSNGHHINVYGKSNFRYSYEARQIAKVLKRPVKFFLGDWDNMQANGRDPIGESAYGINVLQQKYESLWHMSKDELLHYIKRNLKYLDHNKLVNQTLFYIRHKVYWDMLSRDIASQKNNS